MSQERVSIEVARETAELLRARAEALHLSLDGYMRTLAASAGPSETKPTMSFDERAARWEEWTSRYAVETETPIDDSRAGLYTGEDEDQ